MSTQPFEAVPQTLDINASISIPGGALSLNSGPYRVADETFSKLDTKLRRVEATSPFLEGTWTVHAVRENEQFDLNIRIRTKDQASTLEAVQALRKALLQPRFTLNLALATMVMSYRAFAAEHTVEISKPMLFHSQALVKAQITAIPIVL